jgi:hypothetical protein
MAKTGKVKRNFLYMDKQFGRDGEYSPKIGFCNRYRKWKIRPDIFPENA